MILEIFPYFYFPILYFYIFIFYIYALMRAFNRWLLNCNKHFTTPFRTLFAQKAANAKADRTYAAVLKTFTGKYRSKQYSHCLIVNVIHEIKVRSFHLT